MLSILGLLIYLQISSLEDYVIRAELAEPFSIARNIQSQMVIHAALKGEWPSINQLNSAGGVLVDSIKSYSIHDNGHLQLKLQSQRSAVNNKLLAFNLYALDAGNGYKWYSWNCSKSGPPVPYKTEKPLLSTLSRVYSNTACRK